MSLSDQVREFFFDRYVVPAQRHGQTRIIVAASDINRHFGWSNRFPVICGALVAPTFHGELGVKLLTVSEPAPSSTTIFTFAVK